MTRITLITLIAIMSQVSNSAKAQNSSGTIDLSRLTLVLPDGSILPGSKFDSLQQAWGEGRISFRHSAADDANGIMRLVRVTDEMLKLQQAKKEQRKEAMTSLLDRAAPDFTLVDLHGKKWSLEGLKGKIVVLNFWFTTCAPCIHEMPELNKLVDSETKGDVVFLGLSSNDDIQVKAFLEKQAFKYNLLPNSGEVAERYKIDLWPTSIVIDQQGIVRMITGSSDTIRQELEVAINKIRNAEGLKTTP